MLRGLFTLLLINNISNVSGIRRLPLNHEFSVKSQVGRDLISSSTLVAGSRSVEDSGYSTDFVGDYSIVFQSCRNINQWNGDSDQEDANRIVSTNLVRFRLCPSNSCSSKNTSGCSSKYGEYIVDLDTFVYNYLTAQEAQNENIKTKCESECDYYDENDACVTKCLKKYGSFTTLYYDDDGTSFDPLEYAQCSAYGNYFVGPSCSSDGKSIQLGLYTDEDCTVSSNCGSSCFKYSGTSLISKSCMSCQSENGGANDSCTNIYSNSGKCETKMSIQYPNESACKYIAGIKYLQKDGTISNSAKKSKSASLAIGLISFSSILLGTYIHHLSFSKFF